jgi:hypothetical protein
MEQVQGMTLKVETDFLFIDQYNTRSIPGVSDVGLRVMANVVVGIVDDIRPGQQKCSWCGKHSKQQEGQDQGINYSMCPRCYKVGYLTSWDLELVKRYNPCAKVITVAGG